MKQLNTRREKAPIEKLVTYFFLFIFYKFAVDLAYADTYEIYSYWGLFEWQPSLAARCLGWALALCAFPMVLYCISLDKVSSGIVLVLTLCAWVPFTSLVGARADYPVEYIAVVSTYWLFIFLFYRAIPTLKIAILRKKASVFLYPAVIALIATVLYVWISYAGMHLQFHLFEGLYEQRAAAREYTIPTVLGYILVFADNFLPVIMLYFLLTKKPIIGALLAVVIFINFSITASKQIFFLLLIGLLVSIFRRVEITNLKLIYGVFALVAAGIFGFRVFEEVTLNAFLAYRVFFIPAELHFSYFTFITDGGIDFYRQGPLKFFFQSEYSTGIGFLIGEYSIGDITARANNGLFSSAFMNLGYLGAVISPFFTVLYLKVLDGATAFSDARLLPIIVAYVSFVMIGIPLYTAAFSSGFIGIIIFLYIMGDSERSVVERNEVGEGAINES